MVFELIMFLRFEFNSLTLIFKVTLSIKLFHQTEPSSDELKKIMHQHGGHYEHFLYKRKVTHIIATSLPNSKITKGLKHCKVVKPEWITER